MTDCVIYNISIPDMHPSTICVEISRLKDSALAASALFQSDYLNDTLEEFISQYSRTEPVTPDDHTIGFVIVNVRKRVISMSLSHTDSSLRAEINDVALKLEGQNIKVELDL